jgi:hypothetical protein
MRKKFEKIYQFKISLKGIKPSLWRRIQVPEIYTFWDLHVAVQDAMGWQDCHLHDFAIRNPRSHAKERIGIPDEDDEFELGILPGWALYIADYFSIKNSTATYVYDYGDNWEHAVKLEKILPRVKKTKYPRCIAGKRACPRRIAEGYTDMANSLKQSWIPDMINTKTCCIGRGRISSLNVLHLIKYTLIIPGNG